MAIHLPAFGSGAVIHPVGGVISVALTGFVAAPVTDTVATPVASMSPPVALERTSQGAFNKGAAVSFGVGTAAKCLSDVLPISEERQDIQRVETLRKCRLRLIEHFAGSGDADLAVIAEVFFASDEARTSDVRLMLLHLLQNPEKASRDDLITFVVASFSGLGDSQVERQVLGFLTQAVRESSSKKEECFLQAIACLLTHISDRFGQGVIDEEVAAREARRIILSFAWGSKNPENYRFLRTHLLTFPLFQVRRGIANLLVKSLLYADVNGAIAKEIFFDMMSAAFPDDLAKCDTDKMRSEVAQILGAAKYFMADHLVLLDEMTPDQLQNLKDKLDTYKTYRATHPFKEYDAVAQAITSIEEYF